MLIEMAVEENDEEGFAAVQEGGRTGKTDGRFGVQTDVQPARRPEQLFYRHHRRRGAVRKRKTGRVCCFRMYGRCTPSVKASKSEILAKKTTAEIAGINRATIPRGRRIRLRLMLRTETGVYRLVCYSPFDSNNKRHTSFLIPCCVPQKSTILSKSKSTRRFAHRHLSRIGRGQPTHQQNRLRRAYYPRADRGLWCSVKKRPFTDTQQSRCDGNAEKSKLYELEMRNATRNRRWKRQSPMWVGQPNPFVRLGLHSRIKDLRTGYEVGLPKPYWTAVWTFIRSQPEAGRVTLKISKVV